MRINFGRNPSWSLQTCFLRRSTPLGEKTLTNSSRTSVIAPDENHNRLSRGGPLASPVLFCAPVLARARACSNIGTRSATVTATRRVAELGSGPGPGPARIVVDIGHTLTSVTHAHAERESFCADELGVAIDEQAIVIVPVTGDGELGGFSLPHLPCPSFKTGKEGEGGGRAGGEEGKLLRMGDVTRLFT